MSTHARTTSFFSRKQSNEPPPRPSTLGPAQHSTHLNQNSRQMSTDDFGAPQQQQPPPQAPLQPAGPIPTANLHPEIRSVVQLTVAHAHKVYFSGPLVRRIERGADNQKPPKDNGEWTDVWGQLGGTTLSVWNMKEIEEASKEGREVPPTYINMTDAFIQVLGSVTIPGTADSPPKRYMNVITLNTAGSNLLLFSCPTTAALMSWAAALRLAAWEKSRLEEIYTAHLIRITHNGGRDIRSPLIRGRMEGWVRIRIAGQTDWKRMWMVLIAGNDSNDRSRARSPSGAARKNRMSTLFSRNDSSPAPSVAAGASGKPIIAMYSSPKLKDRKKALLTLREVTQAFAVYPERAELISKSTLIKVEGLIGDEETAGGMKGREGWVLIMPELEGGLNQANEMLKWVLGIHDTCELYGRPKQYSWDPRDRSSLMFAYPVGPHKDLLFLDRELAESLDPREDRTSVIRSRLLNILVDRMSQSLLAAQNQGPNQPRRSMDAPPMLPPIGNALGPPQQQQQQQLRSPSPPQANLPQLPPLSFGEQEAAASQPPVDRERAGLTPITERSTLSRPAGSPPSVDAMQLHQNAKINEWNEGNRKAAASTTPMLDRPINVSPIPVSPERLPLGLPQHQAAGHEQTPPYPDQGFRQSSDPAFQSHEQPLQSNGAEVEQPPSLGRRSSEQEPVAPPSSTEDDEPSFIPPRMRSTSTLSSPSAHMLPLPPSRMMSPDASTASLSSPPRTVSPRPPSTLSALTSPFSIMEAQDPNTGYGNLDAYGRMASDNAPHPPNSAGKLSLQPPIYPSPYSPVGGTSAPTSVRGSSEVLSTATSPRQRALPPISPVEDSHNISGEAGALYYMQAMNPHQDLAPRRPPVISEDDEESESDMSKPPSPALPRPEHRRKTSADQQPPTRRGTPMAFVTRERSPPAVANRGSGLSRKPSGARVPVISSIHAPPPSSRRSNLLTDSVSSTEHDSDTANMEDPSSKSATSVDDNADALAAFSFLDSEDKPRALPPPIVNEPERDQPSPQDSSDGAQFRSSFTLSKAAADRKARSQAQQASSHAATLKPGRTKSRRKPKKAHAAGWNESSDEEEEEDEDDEDADSDQEPVRRDSSPRGSSPSTVSTRDPRGVSPGRAPPSDAGLYPQARQPRNLPQPPGRDSEYLVPPGQRRMPLDTQQERRSYYDDGQPQIRQQSEFPTPGAARQNVWSQVLDPGRSPAEYNNGRDTFVQVEPPAQAMTKAFTPQGLLSAGLQDKHDRSAKRQEELARETGASLINVPHKPPPPQMGLLGAITAHERERKREGGVGAALTEREREKRVAEDRQRKVDDLQRQQLEMAQQGGSMYGGQFGQMGMNPMMTGMNPMMPMMTGMGYPGMNQGYNPMFAQQQQMFAAQQAAAFAYQQAMYQFSMAGSQVGGDAAATPGGGGAQQQQPQGMQPNMTGQFDPRMSMFGMGGMGGMGGMSGMGMPPMGSPMGMPMGGYPSQYGMAPQMTGMSSFNPQIPQGTGQELSLSAPQPLGQPERRDSPGPQP